MVGEGFKQTEVGTIPEDWVVRPLGSLIDTKRKITYGIVVPGPFIPNGVPLIRSQDYSKGWVNIDDLYRVSFVIDSSYRRSKVEEGDILLTIVGSVGKVIKVPLVFAGSNITQQTARLAFNPQIADANFYQNILVSELGVREIKNYTKSGVQPSLNLSDVEVFNVPFPPLAEQEAIAGALSDADGLIESLEQLIEKKRQIKQGAMQELLSPWVKEEKGNKQNTTPKLKEGWVEKTLGEVLVGKELGGNYQNSEEYGGEVLIKMGNIARNHISLKKVEKMVTGFSPNSSHRLSYGDVLFNTRNTLDLVGKVSIWRSEVEVAYYNSNLMRMTFCPKLVGSQFFMNYLLNTKAVIAQLRGVAIGTTSVAAIYSRDFSSIILHLPSRDEQVRIAVILDDMDEGICVLGSKLSKAKQLKQGMMQELLTGKIRLV